MQAVIETSGRQFLVKSGDVIEVNTLPGKVGEKVTFDRILLSGDKIGAPYVSGAKVTGTIKEHGFADKILIFTYRRRKNSKKLRGHKQPQTTIEINTIS